MRRGSQRRSPRFQQIKYLRPKKNPITHLRVPKHHFFFCFSILHLQCIFDLLPSASSLLSHDDRINLSRPGIYCVTLGTDVHLRLSLSAPPSNRTVVFMFMFLADRYRIAALCPQTARSRRHGVRSVISIAAATKLPERAFPFCKKKKKK